MPVANRSPCSPEGVISQSTGFGLMPCKVCLIIYKPEIVNPTCTGRRFSGPLLVRKRLLIL